MPAQEIAFRRDKVLYWPKTGVDRYGQATVGAVQEVVVRYDDRETLGRDPLKNDESIDAQLVAAQEFVLQSIVLHSTLAAYTGTGSYDYLEVVSMDVTPDIKNRASAYVVNLKWYKGELPAGIG